MPTLENRTPKHLVGVLKILHKLLPFFSKLSFTTQLPILLHTEYAAQLQPDSINLPEIQSVRIETTELGLHASLHKQRGWEGNFWDIGNV